MRRCRLGGNDLGSESRLVLLGKSENRKPELFSHEIWDFPANVPLKQSIERDEMMKHVFSVTNCTSRFRFGKHEDIHEVNNSHCGGPMVIF